MKITNISSFNLKLFVFSEYCPIRPDLTRRTFDVAVVLSTEKMNSEDGRDFCRANDARLAKMESVNDLSEIQNEMMRQTGR